MKLGFNISFLAVVIISTTNTIMLACCGGDEPLNSSTEPNSNPVGTEPTGGSDDTNTQTFTVNGVSFTMVNVNGGSFTMGATAEQECDANSDAKPAHKVTLSSYSIGQTEVTQALWAAVMGTAPAWFQEGSGKPVERVSWSDCQTFITKLNQLTGKNFRLPTEAEWEYAARGGNHSYSYKYAGSNNIDNVAWYRDNILSYGTQPVARKAPNELGIFDMSGNVWEWCQDWYGNYSSNAQNNPTGPTSGSFRVLRGGGWSRDAKCCYVSHRNASMPTFKCDNFGLRLALGKLVATEPSGTLTNTTSFTVNGVSFKMVSVEGGKFTMDYDWKELPPITLSGFSIGQTEVTQALWKVVMGNNPSYFQSSTDRNYVDLLERPVECVSWSDCQTFITKLNQLTGKNFRLPTEAEWEYAARGGNHSQSFYYAGSNTLYEVAWCWYNIPTQSISMPAYGTQPVAGKAPNELGIFDMSGNVWEWCQDWYGNYSSNAQTNPTGPNSGTTRVCRGGAWSKRAWDSSKPNPYWDFDVHKSCEVVFRFYSQPQERNHRLGLRLAL